MCAQVRRDFAGRLTACRHFYDVGRMGIEHALLPEQGLVGAGRAASSGRTATLCTYGALGAFCDRRGQSTDLAGGMVDGYLPGSRSRRRFGWCLTGRPVALGVSGKDIILHIIGLIGVDGALYRSMEFCGDGVEALSIDDRLCMANMAIEAGAKNGIFPVDAATRAYLEGRVSRPFTAFEPDADAKYAQSLTIDLSQVRPPVAFPHLPGNTRTIDQAKGIKIDQVVIGSCTNGRIEDMRMAASILKGRRVHPDVRLIVIPATQQVSLQMIREGITESLIQAGAAVSTPTCGPCLGGHMGILAAGERAVATTNRNFVGRMGHVDSEVYLASPAVAAASAVAGEIASPEDLEK